MIRKPTVKVEFFVDILRLTQMQQMMQQMVQIYQDPNCQEILDQMV